MNTEIIYDNVHRAYAQCTPQDLQHLKVTEWVKDPSDATTMSLAWVVSLKSRLESVNGPSMDGSVEIKEQINEVQRFKKNRYVDSSQYEDGDDSDAA